MVRLWAYGMKQNRNKIRIIAGKYRRRWITFPGGSDLRPTPDRVRETLFNWLGQRLDGKVCLDLFAGSGVLGFEAASRGAQRVVMVEAAAQAWAALKKTQDLLAATSVSIIKTDALHYLRHTTEKFDLVFLDPPYASALLPDALTLLRQCLREGARVYCEAGNKLNFVGWEVVRAGRVGNVNYGLLCDAQREAEA